ncbi:MAG TPA: hypothetical protein VFL82_10515 [Thermomicrobiales bacterium]|nr:hypothetical protein [Thermomicrobiales bacterium]
MRDTDPTNPTPATPDSPMSTEDMATVRDLLLRAYPDIVPELINGTTIVELTASIEPARAAYQRIAEQTARPAPASPPAVPAGGAQQVIDSDRLPTAEKLRRGLASRGQDR